MQTAFDFGVRADIERIRLSLARAFGRLVAVETLDPADQLVRSLIGSRTRDAVSWAAFERLRRRYWRWSDLAAAQTCEIEDTIAGVTYPDAKARHLGAALRMVRAKLPDLDLGVLARLSVDQALCWLERLPGVGPKVAAAALNFSVLRMPAFVVDTHVLRVLRRFGIVGEKADAWRAREVVMAATGDWSGDEMVELHALLKTLGQRFCRAGVPRCPDCPLRPMCRTGRARGR